MKQPRITKNNVEIYRNIQNMSSFKTIDKNNYEDIIYEGIPLRIFNPTSSEKILIYIHGGGWISGSLDTHTNICFKLANVLKRKVISIGYSLAPEHPFPEGLNECFKVCQKIMHENAWENVAIMGDSAGANLAMGVSLMALHQRSFRFSKIILVYPSCQTNYSKDTCFLSLTQNDKKGFLSLEGLEDYMKLYLKNPEDYQNKYVNILKNKRLFGLSKTLIITASLDPLHDEGLALAKKLKKHLVSVKYYDLKGAIHGYLTHVFDKKYTELTIELIKEFLGDVNE